MVDLAGDRDGVVGRAIDDEANLGFRWDAGRSLAMTT
jgi:hypothetical protein